MSTEDLARAHDRAVEELVAAEAETERLKAALLTIANLDPTVKGVTRKFQMALQTARIALGLEVK